MPRQKSKRSSPNGDRVYAKTKTRGCNISFCCIFSALLIILVAVGFFVYHYYETYARSPAETSEIVGCSVFSVEDVWMQNFPKLLTESAIRLVDVNKDGTLDIIMGFATGADGYNIPEIVCDLYFDGKFPCFGGLLALDGRDGRVLWKYFTEHEVYAVTCEVDIDKDGIVDCIAAGRAGVMHAVSCALGTQLWMFGPQKARNDIMNVYTAQFISDINGDGIEDIINIHGGDPLADPGSEFRLSGRIIFFSGKTGKVLKYVGVPDVRESYYSPQVVTSADGGQGLLFGTGGETHGGSLWYIKIGDLFVGKIEKAKMLLTDARKGFMTPPVLVDITGDGVEDFVVPAYNSVVYAVNGATLEIVWKFEIPSSESYTTPAVGYYNDDAIPDFMIKYAEGPGFPIYYQSKTTILDGKTGKPLLKPYITDTVGSQNSPLTVSIDGHGNDMFLYWIADCTMSNEEGKNFSFVKGTNVHEQSRSDFCKLRFKSHGYSQMYMMSRKSGAPGTVVYDSNERKQQEYKDVVNTSAVALEWLRRHPQYMDDYLRHVERYDETHKSKRDAKIIHKRDTEIFNFKSKTYQKRHVGAHDDHGVQRLLSTGTLAPSLSPNNNNNNLSSIDIIFATYWFFPAKTQAILPGDRDCILDKLSKEAERFDPMSRYFGMDHDAYEEHITKECVEGNHPNDDSGIYESQTDYNPYNVHMGQMTVYRMKLSCGCKEQLESNQVCGLILPFEKQAWSAYMGTFGSSHYNAKRDT